MKTSRHSDAMFLQMLASAAGSAILSIAIVKTLNIPMESGIFIIGMLSYVLSSCFQKKLERLHAKELEAKDVSFVGTDDPHEYFASGLRMGRITDYFADEDINEDPLAVEINEAAMRAGLIEKPRYHAKNSAYLELVSMVNERIKDHTIVCNVEDVSVVDIPSSIPFTTINERTQDNDLESPL